MQKIILATGNKHKVLEISQILAEYGFSVEAKEVHFFEPDSPTLEEVAHEKARQAFAAIKKPAIVEDTGVFFEAYNNFPGGLAKRIYLGIGFTGLLALVKAAKNKNAFFKTAICFTRDGKKFEMFSGELHGTLLDHIVELDKDRLPYEKIFVPNGHKQALAELPLQEKNKISHRGQAAHKLGQWLSKNY